MRALPWIVCGVLAVVLLLAGCRTVKYVPVETVRTDSIYLNRVRLDSVTRYDSIYVRDAGDTVTVERWRYLYRDRRLTDTVYVARVDTVSVPCPVDRELSRWQRVKMELGGWAMGAVLVAAGAVVWLVFKKK